MGGFLGKPGRGGVSGRAWKRIVPPANQGIAPPRFTPHTDPVFGCPQVAQKTPAYRGLGSASRYLSHKLEFALPYPVVRFAPCYVRLLSPLNP
jgi:hypothetical protein